MIHQFLQIIQGGSVQSHLEIAQKMGISPAMVLQIAEDLSLKGYLEENSTDCQVGASGCSTCPAKGGCDTIYRNWSLTEKGRMAIANR